MNTRDLFLTGWTWNPLVALGCATVAAGLAWAFGRRARWGWFAAAVVLAAAALLSPLNLLATGVLFSAHMVQHILLLLLVPALLLGSLPRGFAPRLPARVRRALPGFGWAAGVGAMWFWHVPELCDAAAGNASVHAVQTLSLLALGTAFWWPILAPGEKDRLLPGFGVLYLFTACLACTALGILLTLTPVQVCPIFQAPVTTAAGAWAAWRASVGAERDRQLGGLLMWVPMCFVYLSAIVFELARWHRGSPIGSAARKAHP